MSFAIDEIKSLLEKDGIVSIPDENPNKLFVLFDFENTRFTMMMEFNEESKMMFLSSEIPVVFSVEKEDSAFLASAHINRTLSFGSSTYVPEINRIVFRFYFNMDEDYLNIGMFDSCYYEAIELVKRFYSTIDLLEKGAVLPKDVVLMAKNSYTE